MFEIVKNFIPNLPKIPYRNGVGKFEGVVAHETAGYASKENERTFQVKNYQKAFVHFFVDWNGILQTADTNYIAYGAGYVANQRYVHIELCRTKDWNQFIASYNMYAWLHAYLLYSSKLAVIDGKTLVSHNWVTKNLGGTDHVDPIAYLQSWGISWDKFVSDVKANYDTFDRKELSKMNADDANKIIAFLKASYAIQPSEECRRLANELRKASGQKEE